MKPVVSIILCTYNGEDLIRNCLDSILAQDYPNFEVLCVDGMSSDSTEGITKDYSKKDSRIKLLINKNRLPEGKGNGKWMAFRKAKGRIVGIIDQDNVLQSKDLFSKVISIFKDNKNLVGVLGGLVHDRGDKAVVRYVSLFGTDSFFAYRSVDFLRNFFSEEEMLLTLNNMTLTGGNCFFYLKKDVEKIGGYESDILTVRSMIKDRKERLFIINDATKHYAEKGLWRLIRKKFIWAKNYARKDGKRFNYLPGTAKESFSFMKNLVFCLLIIPNFYYSIRIFLSKGDFVAFLFPFIAFLNTIAYAIGFVKKG